MSLSELEEAKANAVRITKVPEDYSRISEVHKENAIHAGALAFATKHVLTRNQTKKLLKRRVSESEVLFSSLPYNGNMNNYAKKVFQ